MHQTKLRTCPVCGGLMELCFANRAAALSYTSAAAIQRWIHKDRDLANQGKGRVGMAIDGLRLFLPSRAAYFLSYRCESCRLYVVDYGRILSSSEAKTIAENLAKESVLDAVSRR